MEEGSDAIMLISLSVCLCVCAGADPEISFGGPRGASDAEVERLRREDRGAAGAEGGEVWEGGVPLPTGEGGCAPSPEFFFNIAL